MIFSLLILCCCRVVVVVHSLDSFAGMSSPSSSSNTPARSFDVPELRLQQWVPDKEFVDYFDNDNQLAIREMLVDMRGIPFLFFLETTSQG